MRMNVTYYKTEFEMIEQHEDTISYFCKHSDSPALHVDLPGFTM